MNNLFNRPGNTCMFTGPRPAKIAGYHANYQILQKNITDNLRGYLQFHPEIDTFISGAAQGFDMLAFHAVQTLKNEGYNLHNLLAIPFPNQSDLWPDNGVFSKTTWNQMRHLADAEYLISDTPPVYKNDAVKYLLMRNTFMIDHSIHTIALCPFTNTHDPRQVTGGTGRTICETLDKNHRLTTFEFEIQNSIPVITSVHEH